LQRFSESAAQREEITPLQYLLLDVKGFSGLEWAAIGELVERLRAQRRERGRPAVGPGPSITRRTTSGRWLDQALQVTGDRVGRVGRGGEQACAACAVEYINCGTVRDLVATVAIRLFRLVRDAIAPREIGDLLFGAAQSDHVLRIERLHVRVQCLWRVPVRIDRNEQDAHIARSVAQFREHLHQPRHRFGAHVRAMGVAEEDQRGLPGKRRAGNGVAARETEVRQVPGDVGQFPLAVVTRACRQRDR
ncbi:hypothetical protein DFQ30_000778, partial [Apophysomyces sp. BC1015]